MSAIAAIFRRDRGPVSERVLGRLGDALEHRGRDGRDRVIEGSIGVEHLHHWVTPEEIGERQPLRSGDRLLAFDGRIDNREEFLRWLGRPPADPASDAELILAGHELWGDAFCRRLIGPFALALFDLRKRRGLLARDPLGDRTLFYAEAGAELIVGSEEASVLAHPGISADLDESRLLHYFALSVPGDGSTFFRAVSELAPGVLLRFDGDSITRERFREVEPDPEVPASAADRAERYRELLTRAVGCRQRSPAPTAILMSGGLDSTSVAALAAANADRLGGPRPRSISWVFDELTACDERPYIAAVADTCGLEVRQFVADQLGPSLGDDALGGNPSSPEENPYRGLKNRAYREAIDAGSSALLGGGAADVLYAGRSSWWFDLARREGMATALAELWQEIGRRGPWRALRRARIAARPGGSRSNLRPPAWLTPSARRQLAPRPSTPAPAMTPRLLAAAGPRAARGITLERFHAAGSGVDLRHPYRDLRLVEFMLGLPGYELYRHGRAKEIARRSLAESLPESVRTRTEPTRLTPLFDRAVRGPDRHAWRALLDAPQALWPRFVRRDWIEASLERSAGPAADVALWNCLSLEIWRARFDR